ncbi:MAG TPA: TetR/AcrR family transcriptional regulator [Solirubrobacteraceae bacterium]
MASPATRTRQTADERRAALIDAATAEFAAGGLHGTSTHAIAKRAGISQPYIFQLFPTKQDLFLAAVAAGFDRVREAFRRAVADDPENPLQAMGAAYRTLLADRDELLMQHHAYAASFDPEVRAFVRDQFADLLRLIERLSGADPETVRGFAAQGMLLNVVAALDLVDLAAKEAWVARLFEGTAMDPNCMP